MLIRRDVLEAIAAGRITTLFRTWTKPTVRAGGTRRTSVGVLAIDAVEPLASKAVTEDDARAAGYPTRAALLADASGREGTLYRIRVRLAGPDPRIALRERSHLGATEVAQLVAKLDKLDEASAHGGWTRDVLALLEKNPAVRAPDLAASRGLETIDFKRDVRKLKELGLTESLEVGYRLSARGRALVAKLPRAKARAIKPQKRARNERWHASHAAPAKSAEPAVQAAWHSAHTRWCGCAPVPPSLVPWLPLTRRS